VPCHPCQVARTGRATLPLVTVHQGRGQALRPCLDCGRLSPRSRCPDCERARNRRRGSTTQRGYGDEHQRLRAQLIATYSPDDPCARCSEPLGDDPDVLDLGHIDGDPTRYSGLEHRECNRARRPRSRT
jgi:hypothetical protein